MESFGGVTFFLYDPGLIEYSETLFSLGSSCSGYF